MHVTLLSPLAGLVLATKVIVPALRDWRQGEEDLVGVLEHAGVGAFVLSASIAAMTSTPGAIGSALVFGGAAAAETRWGRSMLRRLGMRGSPIPPELPPGGDAAARPGGAGRVKEDAPQ